MADINPTAMATQLATAYVRPAQNALDAQVKSAQATSTGLTKLQSALQAFQTALSSLSGKKGMLKNTVAFDQTGFGTATASSTAQPGSYSVFVEQLATANQAAFKNFPEGTQASGSLDINLGGGTPFTVDLAAADKDGDGKLSTIEIARAINLAGNNKGQVNAMVVSSGTSTQLVLTAGKTGASSYINLDTTNVADAALKNTLTGPTATRVDLTAAKDAIATIAGMKIQQASNTFTSVPGVSMTFTQAQATGATPLNVTVTRDDAGTAGNVRNFIDAYNTLEKALDDLTSTGNAKDGVPAAAFASDAGIRALRDRLHTILREDVGGLKVVDFGISADRKGQLSLDETKMQKKLATVPDGLDKLFGSNSIVSPSGLMGDMNKTLAAWTNTVNGQVKRRRDSLDTMQKSQTNRQTRLDSQYSQAYDRYLRQFSQMQALQEQMNQTTGLLGQLNF